MSKIEDNKSKYEFWLEMHQRNNGDGYFSDGVSLFKYKDFILYSDDEHYNGEPSHYTVYFKDGRDSIKADYGELLDSFMARIR